MGDNFSHISNYYNKLVRKHGHSYLACDYGREESQASKFNVLCEAITPDCLSMLDIGCGFADFYFYLKNKGFELEYTGYDISPAMVEAARKRDANFKIELRNIVDSPSNDKFDFVTANGIFYLLGNDAQEMMYAIIASMYKCCNKVVAFNSLSSWATDKENSEFYADPTDVVNFCRSLTPWVVLRHDYHSRDFTIYMYTEQQKCV